MNNKKKAPLHVLSHTHWDREWYQPFQGYRKRLVFQLDKLLDLLESCKEYKCFHMDGQTACLQDYLEIRPENRQRLEKLIQEERIIIGPWFVMPDEFLVSGESLIRNIQLGHMICRQFKATPMPLGYVTDIFGHCSQLPQILKGFNIDTVMLHRGVPPEKRNSEITWTGADGTNVLLIRVYLSTGYQDFYLLRDWDEAKIKEYEEKKLDMATSGVLYGLDGNDHTAARKSVLDTIKRANKTMSKINCIHSSANDFIKALKQELARSGKKLEKVFGELRSTNKNGAYADVFSGTGSSRVDLKQDNDMLEYLLARIAEQFHVIGLINGGDSQKAFLDLAWKYLLLNHPHDSIVGCSIDQVHKDMEYRFDQARILAEDCIWESLQALEKKIDTSLKKKNDFSITVFNPSQKSTRQLSVFSFELRSKTFEDMLKKGLRPALTDENGKKCYYEITEKEKDIRCKPFISKQYSPDPAYITPAYADGAFTRSHLIVSGQVPAMGYRSWGLSFIPDQEKPAFPKDLSPVIANKKKRTIENKYILIKVLRDGRLNILDKEEGIWHKGAHYFEDDGDNGNGWKHIYPDNDSLVSSKNGIASFKILSSGKLAASIGVDLSMRIPESLANNGQRRKKKLTVLPISTEISLTADSKRINFKTTVKNSAIQHRLRALFPTNTDATHWHGDTAFDIVKRSIKLPDTKDWKEKAREEHPIKNFLAIHNNKNGIALMGKGLCEACVQDNKNKTIALTLFRSFIEDLWWEKTSDSKHSGSLSFEYAFFPFSTKDKNYHSKLFNEVDDYKLPLYPITSIPHSGEFPSSGAFIEIDEQLALSTIKLSEDGKAIIIRIFNPKDSNVSGHIKPGMPIGKAYLTDLLENPQKELEIRNKKFSIKLKAKEIATIRMERKDS